VVTYHLREAGRVPDVALIDGKTERETVDAEIGSALAAADDRRLSVENPPRRCRQSYSRRLVRRSPTPTRSSSR